jgi:hypothetical protein
MGRRPIGDVPIHHDVPLASLSVRHEALATEP